MILGLLKNLMSLKDHLWTWILHLLFHLLINACVRYDKTKKANIGKRRNIYATTIDDTYIDHPTACIDHV